MDLVGDPRQSITSFLWHPQIHIFLVSRIHSSHPSSPNVLIIPVSPLSPKSPPNVNLKSQILSPNSFKSVVGETWSLGVKFLSICQAIKPDRLSASMVIPALGQVLLFQKGKIRRKKEVMNPKQIPNLAGPIPPDFKV